MMMLSVARSCAGRNLSGALALPYWSGGRFAFFRVVGDRSRAPRDDPAWLPAPWRPEVKDPGAGPIG
jgi:hypothetical protein